ncbi:hypothetical protein HXX76_007564 [Chlamydomonas incerta]|uniref:Protein kinase domain-containing protein n=1 Tax=Chlamydomonas incerta TaxID=51695 RepID=A0A835SZP4_CHLIN|nr:hypothetical protein HXX76_007564 [Chlamydomonas incerta]|eukprot:KAG2434671.1 hypothetical protein HXX76_007564 [Chlamydomonas incerta]
MIVLTFAQVTIYSPHIDNITRAPSWRILDRSDPGSGARLMSSSFIFFSEACNPMSGRVANMAQLVQLVKAAQAAGQLPADIPIAGITPRVDQTGCVELNRSVASTTPIARRCWPDVMFYGSMVAGGQELNSVGAPEATNYIWVVQNLTSPCLRLADDACLDTYGPLGCNAWAIRNIAPAPIIALGNPNDAGTAGTGGGGGGNEADDDDTLAIALGCALGGVALLALATGGVVLWRSARQQTSGPGAQDTSKQDSQAMLLVDAEAAAGVMPAAAASSSAAEPEAGLVDAVRPQQQMAAALPLLGAQPNAAGRHAQVLQRRGSSTGVLSDPSCSPNAAAAEGSAHGSSHPAHFPTAQVRKQQGLAGRTAAAPLTYITSIRHAAVATSGGGDCENAGGVCREEAGGHAVGSQGAAASQAAAHAVNDRADAGSPAGSHCSDAVAAGVGRDVAKPPAGAAAAAPAILASGGVLPPVGASSASAVHTQDVPYCSGTGSTAHTIDVAFVSGSAGGTADNTLHLLPVVRGRGGFGRVYEGMYRGQKVAVKMLIQGNEGAAGNTAALVKTLQQEVDVLGRCSHPNVVRLIAASLDPHQPCLVMELCETSLEALVFNRGGSEDRAAGTETAPPVQLMPLEQVLNVALGICSALSYMHPTIIHRDLKPANVLLNKASSDAPEVKLADFGLARIRATTMPTAEPEAGTAAYLAPECFDVNNAVITHHADLYSLGVCIWAMLTGEQPWRDFSIVAIAFKVCGKGERLPLDHIPWYRCPYKLQQLIMALFDRDPLRRPAAEEAAKQLMLLQQQLRNKQAIKNGYSGRS